MNSQLAISDIVDDYKDIEMLNIEKILTLSYNIYLMRQIFELRHSPSSGTENE